MKIRRRDVRGQAGGAATIDLRLTEVGGGTPTVIDADLEGA